MYPGSFFWLWVLAGSEGRAAGWQLRARACKSMVFPWSAANKCGKMSSRAGAQYSEKLAYKSACSLFWTLLVMIC